MLRLRPRLTLGMVGAAVTAVAVLHGCTNETTEPSLSAGKQRYRLIIGAGSSTANGVVTANKGGVACTVVGGTGGAEAIGTCTGLYPAGTVVSVTASPGAGAELKLDAEWGQTCEPNVENRRICQVTMDSDRTVAPTFVPSSTSFTLTVNGGAGGSGTVFSTPMGISCTIVRGQATSGNCSAGFPRGAQVKLTARTGQGRRLKAWAGGRCEAGGDGVGASSGSCVTTMGGNVNVVVSFDDLFASAVAAGTLGQWDAPIRLACRRDQRRAAAQQEGLDLRSEQPCPGSLGPGCAGNVHRSGPARGFLLQWIRLPQGWTVDRLGRA